MLRQISYMLGAKINVDPHHDVIRRLLKEALRMSGALMAQEAANLGCSYNGCR